METVHALENHSLNPSVKNSSSVLNDSHIISLYGEREQKYTASQNCKNSISSVETL